MIPYWLKPNKVGIAFFIILLLLILFVFSGYFAFFFYFLELFGILELFGGFFRFLDLLEHTVWDWRWHLRELPIAILRKVVGSIVRIDVVVR